ncbi:uncharacterized protein FOMMEDRAFT_124988 [Fomitiporia mediterranea MF3/22]|uniref:uncharacterized protein n=1 Tax=Fomitiporia mediterranea (strain MF3/22) TaxID=694068 RepID=UPI0004408503|nr:uncharacterized protein FOMMEDRAFT_124988 [Fomitiporia mediterranea MF3/22]EJD02484.1 hypothetical protein FOMMEDRAFT_124988 [Fomitiporia mediterranea MF3/22]
MKRTKPSSEHSSTPQNATQKKTRFVSPEDDPARFAEDVDAQLEDSKKVTRKQGRVKTEGYESDSSDDGEGVVLSRRKDAAGEGGEDEDDMFAAGDKEEKDEEVSGKKKKTEYLRLGDIEGQEFNEASGSDKDDSEESEGEPEDEDDAERRKKAGMGYELSSFNMREEMEEGKFTEDGTFVRTFDPHAIHDRWLEDADDRAIKKARRAKRAQERAEKEKLRAEAREAQEAGGKEEMEKEMLTMLKKGETVLEALARLGEKVKKAKGKERSNKKSRTHDPSMDVDNDSKPHADEHPTSFSQLSPKSKIEHLTTLASNLMSLGDVDIYNKTYEHLLRSVRSGGNVEPDWTPPAVKYEYKWDVPGSPTSNQSGSGAGTDTQVFGPFGEDEMKAWYDASYFGEAGEKVKVRVVGEEWGDWDDVVD